MNSLAVVTQNENLVIDSRLVAAQLDVTHSAWMQNVVKKYQTEIEQAFGVLYFENSKPKAGSSGGRPELFTWLTEDQCVFLITLSRNTDQVITCKANIVKAFSNARKKSEQPSVLGAYTERVLGMFDDVNRITPGYWCVLHESANLLIWVETKLKMPVDKADLLDGSIGIHWANYRKKHPWAGDRIKFNYRFPDGRYVQPWCYQMQELEHFRNFLDGRYRSEILPKYLKDKYPGIVKVS